MSNPKELQFFSRDFARGLEWYESFFDGAAPHQVRGEASPQYSRCQDIPRVPERMFHAIPDVRLIYLVRDPLTRIVSHYAHWRDLGQENLPLPLAVRENPVFIDASMYWRQMSSYLEFFTPEQILVLPSEQLIQGPREAFARVCSFIGVDPNFEPASLGEAIHVGGSERTQPGAWFEPTRRTLRDNGFLPWVPIGMKRRARVLLRRPLGQSDLLLDDETREYLRLRLTPDVRALAAWLGQATPAWAKTYLEE